MNDVATFLSEFSRTRVGLVVDDLGRGRSVLLAPAQEISEEMVNRIITLSGGLTFVAISPERAAAFMLPTMSRTTPSLSNKTNSSSMQYISVEAREGVTTGISAADRATTIRILGSETIQPRALVKPGHIFPIETRTGGVIAKAAVPEATLDLITLAGFTDAALFVDLLDRDGELLPRQEALAFAARHSLPVITLSKLIQYRLAEEPLVHRAAEAVIPTKDAGDVKAVVYRSTIHDIEHIALVKGSLTDGAPVLTRVQVENTIADVFGGAIPNSRQQLSNALRAVGEHGSGVVLYLRRPSPTDGFAVGGEAVESSHTNASAQMREYGIGAQILRDLGVTEIELLSSTNRHLEGLASFGIRVVRQRPIPAFTNERK